MLEQPDMRLYRSLFIEEKPESLVGSMLASTKWICRFCGRDIHGSDEDGFMSVTHAASCMVGQIIAIDTSIVSIEERYGDSIKSITIPLRIRVQDMLKEVRRMTERNEDDPSQWEAV